MDRIKFTKIGVKLKGDITTVVLHFTEPTDAGGSQLHDIECKDAPLDSFLEAMRNLDSFVGLLCGFPKDYAEGCKVHTVSIGSVHGKTAVILSASKSLEELGKAFNFNTPRFTETAEESDTSIPDDLLQAVNRLVEEANHYRCGERSQVAMDLKEGEAVDDGENTPAAADSEEWEGAGEPDAVRGDGDASQLPNDSPDDTNDD